MNKTASIIITLGLVICIGIIFLGSINNKKNTEDDSLSNGNNVVIKDGIQYVTIVAKGGYSPKTSTAQAGIPTKLVMKTKESFDCSLSLVIRSVGFKKILSQSGEEVIDIGTPKAGEPLQGVCSMGMYNFVINFT
jgi:plastocyanin domain-containing protein